MSLAINLLVVFTLFQGCGDPSQTQSVESKRDTFNPETQCLQALKAQNDYLSAETYSLKYTFSKFPSTNEILIKLRDLNVNSSFFTYEFRTKLREELAKTPVNFDHRYSIVAVGMTGWGENFWILDRKTGHAYEFPFHAISLDFKKESKLLIMNSKARILELNANSQGCYYYNQEKVTDLRPFYFIWEAPELKLLGPLDLEPTVNSFWIDYADDLPGDLPEPVSKFIRESKKKLIGKLLKVPQSEGYTGFDLLKIYPGLIPNDFADIQTPYGNYKVIEKRLYFEGNAPSNAAALDHKGWQQLINNISARLKIEINAVASVDSLIVTLSK